MALRTRSRQSAPEIGTFLINGSPSGSSSFVRTRESCTDVNGQLHTANFFSLSRFDGSGIKLANAKFVGAITTEMVNYVALDFYVYGVSDWAGTNPPAPPSASTIAGLTNVNRPEIVPLSLLQDLYDLPRLLRDAGSILSKPRHLLSQKQLANANLMTQFGVFPLISDVRNLLQVQAKINKRYLRLANLYKNGGEHRRVTLSSPVTSSSRFLNGFDPFGLNSNCNATQKVSYDCWATCKWQLLSAPPSYPNYEELRSKALRITLGLTPRGLAEGAWDLVPWSFLVDWFTDAHYYFLERLGSVSVVPDTICYMVHKTMHTEFIPAGNVQHGGVTLNESKSRTVLGSPSITASLPALSLNDLSILGSLFVQRFKD